MTWAGDAVMVLGTILKVKGGESRQRCSLCLGYQCGSGAIEAGKWHLVVVKIL